MKTYHRHNCSRNHRKYRTLAKCMFPRACWVQGEGDYALLAWCPPLSVSLWWNKREAEEQKEFIDRLGCGHTCTKRHEIVLLEFE